MPAIFDSLVHARGLTPHVAWRVAYVVPFILITCTAVGMLVLCDDTPTGKWSERHIVLEGESVSPPPEMATDRKDSDHKNTVPKEKVLESPVSDVESMRQPATSLLQTAQGEVIVAPTFREALSVIFSLHSLALAAPYACSFGRCIQFTQVKCFF